MDVGAAGPSRSFCYLICDAHDKYCVGKSNDIRIYDAKDLKDSLQ
jgi:hypothetical protein